jgi:hypothetical protein
MLKFFCLHFIFNCDKQLTNAFRQTNNVVSRNSHSPDDHVLLLSTEWLGVSAELELKTERDTVVEFYILKINLFLWHGRQPDGIALPFTFAE